MSVVKEHIIKDAKRKKEDFTIPTMRSSNFQKLGIIRFKRHQWQRFYTFLAHSKLVASSSNLINLIHFTQPFLSTPVFNGLRRAWQIANQQYYALYLILFFLPKFQHHQLHLTAWTYQQKHWRKNFLKNRLRLLGKFTSVSKRKIWEKATLCYMRR